jgi:hypothetical protein
MLSLRDGETNLPSRQVGPFRKVWQQFFQTNTESHMKRLLHAGE